MKSRLAKSTSRRRERMLKSPRFDGRVFRNTLPVSTGLHWATFNLAIHPWSEPAETVYRLGTHAGVPLIMPRLGAPTEPEQADGVEPWWRDVASTAPEPLAESDAPESLEPLEQLPD